MSEGRPDGATQPTGAAPPVPWGGLAIVAVWLTDSLILGLVAKVLPAGGASEQAWLPLWATVLSLPLRLAAAVLLLRVISEARPEQMGLTWRHAGRDALLGAGLALPLAAVVYGVNLGVEVLLRPFSCGAAQEHPFTELARQGPTAAQWLVLLGTALVAAPAWEEFLFRGLVQPWAVARPWAASVLMGLAVVLAFALRSDSLRAAWQQGGFPLLAELVPALAALLMVPVYLWLRRAFASPVPAGVFAAAVLFGWFHVRVWPSPVALTLLGAGLGWLAWRTRGLAAPVALHATFNLIAVVVLLAEAWG